MKDVVEEYQIDNSLAIYSKFLKINSISMYLKEIDKIPLLGREMEISLAKRVQEGSRSAKERLIISNLRFVVSVAKKYQGNGVPLSDLINEGNLGLIVAANKFDYKRGFHFISYAVWWIKQSIMKAISEKSRMVRLPMNRANELMRIGKFSDKYTKENGNAPSIDVIATELSMNRDEIKKLIDISSAHASLENLDYEVKRISNIHSTQTYNDETGSPDDTAVYSSLRDDIDKLLDNLSDRERKVIEYRFGLNGKEAQSLSKIGVMLSLTKERIRQIEKIAMDRIRGNEYSQSLYSYLN